MLENLDSVAWSQLTHAYGAATDVPAQIRNLASANEVERENALWELYGNIFHEGARYQATPYAVPFLYELVTAPETPDRHEIVYLLVSLALGYEESYLPDGLDVANIRRAFNENDSEMSLTDQAECDEYAAEELQISGEDIRFNEGNLAGYAILVLARGGVRARDKIVPALCGTLKSVSRHQSLDVTRALLDLIVGARTTPIKDMPAGALDPLELSALREIARHGGWKIGHYVSVNYCELVREYGLPDSQESLIEYLSQ